MKRNEFLEKFKEKFFPMEDLADRLVDLGVLEADEPERLGWEGGEIGVETTATATLGVGVDGGDGIIATDDRYRGVASYPDYEANLAALARRHSLLLELERWAKDKADVFNACPGLHVRVEMPYDLFRKLRGEA